jgi:hypothetical protein
MGPEAEDGKVIFTAYKDRSDFAQKLVEILPACMNQLYDRKAVQTWFTSCAMSICDETTLTKDDDGNWTGKWHTFDDQLMQDVINEDMGFDIDLSGLKLLEQEHNTNRVLLETDNASVDTFGVVMRQPNGESATASDASAASDAKKDSGDDP